MSQDFAANDPGNAGGIWRPLTALGLAAVFGVVVFALTSDGGNVVTAAPAADVVPATESTIPESTTTTTAPPQDVAGEPMAPAHEETPPETDEVAIEDAGEEIAAGFPATLGGGEDGGASSMPAFLSGQITNMGPTEIGLVTNLAATNYTWERIEIEGPGLSDAGWLGDLAGRMVAVSVGVVDGSDALVTAVSDDGLSWERVGSFSLPDDMWISRIVGDGERVFAIGQGPDPFIEAAYLVFSTSDGAEWATAEIDLSLAEDEHAYIQDVVAGPAGLALAVGLDTYPEEPPAVLVFDEYEVTLNHMRGTYTLTEAASGDEVLSGRLDDLFNAGEEGQSVYDMETGELITVVPWQVWERSWGGPYGGSGGSPLPIPIGPGDPGDTPGITIEHDGYIVTVEEFAGRFSVVDAESGEEITSGTLDELYQGPPPQLVDPSSGEELLSVTWDEWHRAEEQAWQDTDFAGEGYFYRSRTGLVTSPDGATWATKIINEGSGGSSAALVATDNGFVAVVNTYSEFGEHGEVWTMSDGVWTSQPSERTDMWLRSLAMTDSGLVAIGEGSGGPALWSSPDGVDWNSEFAIVPQDDGTYAHLSSVAEDSGTIGVLAVRERWSEYRPLEIVQDQYTATFEDGESVVRVTGTASGEEVLRLTWEDVDSGFLGERITWDDGATSIDLGNGDVMVITDEEAYTALEALYSGSGEIGLSVFLDSGSGWSEAVVDVAGAISGAARVFLVDGRIYIGGSYWGEEGYSQEGPVEDTLVLIVGTPAG